MADSSKISIIVVAAGSGSRFRSDVPKQFCLLDGCPVVVHALRRLREALPSAQAIVVISSRESSRWAEISRAYGLDGVAVAHGGASRWESVRNGLSLVDSEAEVVLVHDGARPLVDTPTVKRVVDAARNSDGAIPVVDVVDSLRMVSGDGSSVPVDRSVYKAVQTPQGFPASKLRQAYALPFSPLFTDDASVMAAAGYTDISLVEGAVSNLKITNPRDIEVARVFLRHDR